MKKKLIMDIDTGIDDALAIVYAVRSKQFDILGCTTNFGNVPLEIATRNTGFVLDKLGQSIPIYPGSAHPFHKEVHEFRGATHIHGEDGLGNTLESNDAAAVTPNQSTDFIIEQLHAY